MHRSTCFGCFQAPDAAAREMSWPKEWTYLSILFEHTGLPVIRVVRNLVWEASCHPWKPGYYADFQVLFISSYKELAVIMSSKPKVYACLIAKSILMLLLYTR